MGLLANIGAVPDAIANYARGLPPPQPITAPPLNRPMPEPAPANSGLVLTENGLQPTAQQGGAPLPAVGNAAKAREDERLAQQGPGTQVAYSGPAGAQPSATQALPPEQGGAGRPAGWVPTTQESESKTVEGSPEQKARLEAANRNTELGQRLGEAAQASAIEQAPLIAKQQQQQANLDAFHAKEEADRAGAAQRESLIEEAGKRAKAHAEYDLAVSKGADPDRMWNDKSLAGKAWTGLALVLNGLMPHHQFWTHYYQDRDIDLDNQRKDIEAKGKNAADADSHYALFLKQGMEPDQAKAAARVLTDKQMGEALQAKMAEQNTGLQKLNLAKMIADHGEQTQKDILDEMKVTAPIVTRKSSQKYQQAVAAGSGGDADLYRKYADNWLKDNNPKKGAMLSYGEWSKARGGAGEAGGPGANAPASQKDAENIRAHQEALKNLDQLISMRKTNSGGTIDPAARKEGRAIAARTQEQLVAALGKTNSQLLERTMELIPEDPLAYNSAMGAVRGEDVPSAQMESARRMLQSELDNIQKTPGAVTAIPSGD